jgi:hypothetical protein
MQPLVLAIEPDTRQAAIVKRIVREKVMADVTVVDSRDAALEAMRTTIPDVLLLSTLLSPRDEDELFAHLRTLRDAEHLQTHTIPQLSSAFGDEDDKPRGLLSAFRRKKTPERVTGGCDPDLFAEEIRTYLKHASDKKKHVREMGPMAPIGPAIARPGSASTTPNAAQPSAAAEEPAVESSWSSPFEWRPTQSRVVPVEQPGHAAPRVATAATVAAPEPFVAPEPLTEETFAAPLIREPEPVMAAPEPEVASAPPISDWRSFLKDPDPVPEPESVEEEPATVVAELSTFDAEPVTFAAEPVTFAAEPVAFVAEPETYTPEPQMYAAEEAIIDESMAIAEEAESPGLMIVPSRARYPLTVRKAKGWWFVEGSDEPKGEPDSELREVLAGLAVPQKIAGVAYAEGCRIRRVRLVEAA